MADEVPDHIKKFNKMHRKANAFANAIDRHARQAYDYAVGEHLRTEDGGIDLEKLEDEAVQEKVATSMSDFYVKKAKQQFKSEIPEDDEFKKSLLVRAYGQATKAQLKYAMNQLGKGFTFDKYNRELVPEVQKHVKQSLTEVAGQHLNESHIESIIKYTKSNEFIDPNKLNLHDAMDILYTHKAGGLSPEYARHKVFKKKDYYDAEKKAAA